MGTFHKILCATDFSEGAHTALNLAVCLSRDSCSEVIVIYVEPSLDGAATDGAMPEAELHREHAETVRDLCALIESQTDPKFSSLALVRRGEPGPEIVRAAREHDVDLILLGASNDQEPSVEAMMTREFILGEATCSVLIAKNSRFDEKTDSSSKAFASNVSR